MALQADFSPDLRIFYENGGFCGKFKQKIFKFFQKKVEKS